MARAVVVERGVAARARSAGRSVRWTVVDTIGLTAVTLMAGGLRLFRATTPSRLVFDEGYYAIEACEQIFGNGPPCHREVVEPISGVHPPLGTWLIGAGIRIFGFRSGGWRVASLAAGTLTVVLVFLLARRLIRSTLAATVASGALALDALHFIHSRVAMLEIFVTLFAVAAILAAVLDGDRPIRITRAEGRWHALTSRLRERRWRLAAGAAIGAAVACKWSGIPFAGLTIGIVLASELRRRSVDARGGLGAMLREEGPSLLVAFALVPALIYVGSYIGRIEGAILAWPWSRESWMWAFLAQQRDMLAFHLGLDLPHVYASPPWSWPLMKRPPIYWLEVLDGRYREIIAIGNPLVWLGGLASLVVVAIRWLRRHRDRGEAVIVLGFAAAWLPWLLIGPTRETVFSFYLVLGVPFLCIGIGYMAARLAASIAGRVAIGGFAAASIACFAFFYPVVAAVPISEDAWRDRILFADCDLHGVHLAAIDLPEGVTSPVDSPGPYPEAQLRGGPAPAGWCWI